MIYLDNAATTYPKPEGVYRRIDGILRTVGGSPGRASHRMALDAARVVFNAREKISRLINCPDSSRIVFTKNATEAINIVLKGLLKPADHMVTTTFEHNAVANTILSLEQSGVKVTRLRPVEGGFIRPDSVESALTSKTRIVCISHASNVFGTIQDAAAGLPHGGGKSVLYGDPKMPAKKKETLIRAMACALRDVSEYIPGPDMGTDEACMAWIKDEIGRSVGLPREVGGIPLDELGATGWGIRHAAAVAVKECDFELAGARVVVQGFGAVGKHAASFLAEKGAVLVGACDSRGAVYNPKGLDVKALIELKKAGRSVAEYEDGESMERDAVIDMECEIWIPAARPDVIHEENVHRLKTTLIISGANIPITAGAENILHDKGILSVPDFIANAGGVICAAMEYKKVPRSIAFKAISEKVTENTELVLTESKREGIPPREAAFALAHSRVKRAMSFKRFSVF